MNTYLKRLMMGALIFLGAVSFAFAAQCLGTTRAGKQCKNQGGSSGYCHYHNPAATHCAAKTKDGSPCRNSPKAGSAYCGVHNK